MLEQKLLKAKIELMTRSVFLSTINLSVKHVVSKMVATAGTDCKQIMYNPDFCKNLSIVELTGLMAHECWHIAFMHKLRQGDRNHVLWNKAADYVINNMLLDSGYDARIESVNSNGILLYTVRVGYFSDRSEGSDS